MTISESSERIIIYDLEIENFKSYAGKRSLGPFHRSFTSIVGANGSGKSNVIDAILFVFGYRSSKIRSKKLSLLIHNSQLYPNVESCKVLVEFRKVIGDVIDNDFKITLSRIARKDNSNDYYLNGSKSSYKEITHKLREFHVDLDYNRFLILQGEVEQISLMKPKGNSDNDEGLLEFLEDIIGSVKYKKQIEEITKIVDDYSDQMVEKINRVKIVEREKDSLQPHKDEALKYVNYENKLNSLTYLDNYIKLKDLKEQDFETVQKMEELSSQKQLIEKEMEQIKEERTEKANELKEVEKTCNPLIKSIDALNKQVMAIERKYLKAKQDLTHSTNNRDKATSDLQSEQNAYDNLKSAPMKNRQDLEKLNRGKGIIESEINEIETRIESLLPEIKKKTASLVNDKEQKEKVLLEKSKVLSEAEINVNKTKNSLDILVSKKDYLTSEIQKTKNSISNHENQTLSKIKILENAKKDIPKLIKDQSSCINKLEDLKNRYQDVCSQLTEKRQTLDTINSNEQAVKNRSKIISELMKQKESGKIRGIHGRLGDLASVDPKYDCAVSSSSSFLDHCLVDTMDTAIKCVEFLRNNNLGISSFIALDKMSVHINKMKQAFKAPAGSLRLFDLVTISTEIYRPAFYFALRDTLVADNIDAATKIAFDTNIRYRVSTLKGDIVEKNGTITSGGQPITGRIKLSNDPSFQKNISLADIDQGVLKKSITKLEREKTKLNEEIAAAEDQTQKDSSTLKDLENKIGKLPKEIEIHQQECKSLRTLLEKHEDEYKKCLPDQNELHKAQMDYELQKKEKDKAQSNYDVVEDQIRKINQQISAVKGGILDIHQTELISKKRLLDDINMELSKASAQVTSNQRQMQKSEATIKELESTLSKIVQKIERLEEEVNSYETQMMTEKGSLEKLQAENSESCDRLKSLKSRIQELDISNESFRKQILDIKLKFDNISSRVQNYESKVKHIQAQMEKLVHRSFDELGNEIISPVTPPDEKGLHTVHRHKIHDQIKDVQSYLDSHKPDFNSIDQYYKKNRVYIERVEDLDSLTTEKDLKNNELKEIKSKRLTEFMEGFTIINLKLKEMYQLITLGGDAELELVDSLNPFIEGVVFSVRPPKKSWKHIANLSGGEKTLSSLSLVFALHHYKPTPFYVMDEIDAALDFKNVSIVASYIKERTQNAQFIIISLRDNMFELANRLVGIYKTDDCTKSVILDMDLIQKAC